MNVFIKERNLLLAACIIGLATPLAMNIVSHEYYLKI